MPGHFTHIYTARRVADYLGSAKIPDWPDVGGALQGFDRQRCARAMKRWEKFTAIGAIGPDLFYFCQDWNNNILAPVSDELMLAIAVYYYIDKNKEEDWEPLLLILDEANSQLAALLRFLIKLQKIWQTFVDGWNATIGPIVADIDNLIDGLTGGVLSQFGVVLDELKLALETIAEEELLTYHDIFTYFDTCVQKGYGEKLFLWSDMSHYRRPSALCQSFIKQVHALEDAGEAEHAEQFLAFTLGYITHLGTDTVAHSFVNEQCGGPYRNHPQRHHLIENHIDAWNYQQTMPGGRNAADPWGFTEDYPDVSMSALWFAVQLTPDSPDGVQRPEGPFEDDDARQKALDVDGEMPDWMADCIVLAMMDCYQDPEEHPQILQGSTFQSAIDAGLLTKIFTKLTGGGLDGPFQDLLKEIAPKPSFDVKKGFPLPWEIKTVYRLMYSYYRFVYNGTWELEKPRKPDVIILPPASDFSDLFQPPDLSGVDSSNPLVDICELLIALIEWAVKAIEAAIKLVGDLIKMVISPATYPVRLALYMLAMWVWDIVMKTHEVLAHTGFLSPHSEQTYPDGELRLPNEIDLPLITLGGTVDSAFLTALAAAFDPLGNLDKNPDVIGTGHAVRDSNYPYYPVLRWQPDGTTDVANDAWEYRRPWAWPNLSPVRQPSGDDALRITPTETYSPLSSFGAGPQTVKPVLPGPYPAGTQPDVFFRTNAPVDPEVRRKYEQAQTPWDTDQLNVTHIGPRSRGLSPLGDPIPFSAHLIAQIANDTGYSTQFNLDSDRAFAYLTWDWIRNDPKSQGGSAKGALGITYPTPKEPPEGVPGVDGWEFGNKPLLLEYKDAPANPAPPEPPPIE
jgi:hypothetical protein